MTARSLRKTATRPRRVITFVPPEGVQISLGVAGLGARFAAQLLDIILTFSVAIAIMIALTIADILPGTALVSIGALLFFALRVPYYTLAEILWNGQTLGKRILGLRVISGDGRTLSAHAVTMRNLMKEMEVFVPGTMLIAGPALDTVSAILLVVWIAILLAVPLSNRKRQRLGDIMANTFVITQPRAALLPELAATVTQDFPFLPHHLDHYGAFELQTLETLLQVTPDRLRGSALRRHEENLVKVAQTILTRIDYDRTVGQDQAEPFLRAFYRTQRSYLENRQLFGDTRADKHHAVSGETME